MLWPFKPYNPCVTKGNRIATIFIISTFSTIPYPCPFLRQILGINRLPMTAFLLFFLLANLKGATLHSTKVTRTIGYGNCVVNIRIVVCFNNFNFIIGVVFCMNMNYTCFRNKTILAHFVFQKVPDFFIS